MNEAQFTIQKVEVIVQAFAAPTHHFQSLLFSIAPYSKGRTIFQCVEDTNQTFCDLVFCCYCLASSSLL